MAADGTEDSVERAARLVKSDRIVARKHKEVDRVLVVDCIKEPLLLDQIGRFNDLGNIAVAGEIEEDPEGHDVQTPLGGEVAVLRTDVLESSSGGVLDLHIASEILVTVHL